MGKRIILLILAGVACFFASAAWAQAPITQAEWAVYLARGLGLEEKLPPGTKTRDYITTLASKGYRRIEGENYQNASPSLRRDDAVIYGRPSNKQWVRAGKESGKLKYRFKIPLDREYTLRARVRGAGQFWTVDQKGSFLVTPGKDLEWLEVGDVTLSAGEHEITVSVPPGGGVDVFELVSGNAPAIAPAGGFQPLVPLTFGAKAETLVKALNLEDQLPIASDFYLIIEAERFDRAEGAFRIQNNDRPGRASEQKWLSAGGTVISHYSFEVPRRGLYSIRGRGFGPGESTWTIDEGADKVEVSPHSADRFGWYPVTTLLLEKGIHTIELELKGGDGADVIMVIRRLNEPGNYLQLLSDLGISEGALPGKDVDKSKRRYELYRAVEAETYEGVRGKVARSDSDHFGIPSDHRWVQPLTDNAVLGYKVQVKEDGMYSFYSRGVGPYPLTWTIDADGKKFRERRMVFPRSEEEFNWQEVVTLELGQGEHVFVVDIPRDDGLDVFELRQRPWTGERLDSLARQEVYRDEALRNIEAAQKEQQKKKEPEWEPTPPLEPTPVPKRTPYYPPLSTYLPSK